MVTWGLSSTFAYSCRLLWSDSFSSIHYISTLNRVLCPQVLFAIIFTVFHEFIPFNIIFCLFCLIWPGFLSISPYWAEFFHVSTIAKHCFLHSLCFSFSWPTLKSAQCLPHLYFQSCLFFCYHDYVGFIIQAIYELFFQPPVILIFTVCGLNVQSAHPFLSRFLTFLFNLHYWKTIFCCAVFEFLPSKQSSCYFAFLLLRICWCLY